MHFIICQLITHENSYFLKEAAAYLYEHFQLFFLFVSKFFLFLAKPEFSRHYFPIQLKILQYLVTLSNDHNFNYFKSFDLSIRLFLNRIQEEVLKPLPALKNFVAYESLSDLFYLPFQQLKDEINLDNLIKLSWR